MNFLEPPVVRDLETFTSMPQEFRRTGVRSVWADANRGGAPVDSFLEGPVFDTKGNLYVTDIPFGRIFRISAEGSWTLVAGETPHSVFYVRTTRDAWIRESGGV